MVPNGDIEMSMGTPLHVPFSMKIKKMYAGANNVDNSALS